VRKLSNKATETDEFRGLIFEGLNSVYRLACQLARSNDEAEDLVQETYVQALQSRSTFCATNQSARPWLFTILHNTYKTRVSRRQGRPAVASDAIEDFKDPLAPASVAGGRIACEQVDERLKQTLNALPPAYRAILLMWAVEDLKYCEIARIIDEPVETVTSRLHCARQRIMEQIDSRYAVPSVPGRRGAARMNEPTTTASGDGAQSCQGLRE